jgi:hypothetical protein
METPTIDLGNALPIAMVPHSEIASAAKQVLDVLAANSTFIPPPRCNAIRKVVVVEGAHYEQRLNCCHKPLCRSCFVHGKWIPSHGPYWYLCLPLGRKWVRVYLGKHLDTNRFRGKDGKIDYSQALPRSRRSTDPTTNETDAPGQLRIDEDDAPTKGIGP